MTTPERRSPYDPRDMASWRTLDDAAREAGVSRSTINRWIAAGKLTEYAIAGDLHRYVDIEAVHKLRQPKPVKRAK